MSRYDQDLTEEKIVNQLRELKIQQIDPEVQSRVLHELGRHAQTTSTRKSIRKSRRRARRWSAGMIAGAAGVCVAAGVVYVSETHSPFTGGGTHTTGTGVSAPSGHTTKPNVSPNFKTSNSSSANHPAVKVNKQVSVHTYTSTASASKAVMSLEQGIGLIGPNAHKYSLGNGIQAKWQGGAGTQKYQWQEGNWTIITSFLSSNPKAKSTAQQMVSYLHNHALPAPQGKGTVISYESSNSPQWHTVIAWQVGKKVYKITKTESPLAVLKIAVSAR